jgi:hypothetical protein
MTQGYSMPSYNPDTKQHYLRGVRDVRIVEALVNEELPGELFQMKFEEGLTVIDRRSGKSVIYNYIATPLSLLGKPLPDFENIKIDFNPSQAKGKQLLVCFWDMNQRPSRNCIIQLAKQAEGLKQKDVTVVVVHASKVEKKDLNTWVKKNRIPFPVGMAQGDETKTRLTWGIRSLPWLILTDRRNIVRAEGFTLYELSDRIDKAQDSTH